MKLSQPARVFATLLVAAVCATGCVSMPTGGPVQSYPVTQAADAQNQPYAQVVPQEPGANWAPWQVVQGFLTASASFGDYSQVAMQYLTSTARARWKPTWSAIVYKDGPNVTGSSYSSGMSKDAQTATVRITGTVQATLQGYGNYSVPSASGAAQSSDSEPVFTLAREGGQWRISQAPREFLLTSDSFKNDYQLSKLYFLNPSGSSLVPDPVYVPVTASLPDLMNGLVNDLITPPADWLDGATKTAFPAGTKIKNVSLNGVTAVVNLTGAAMVKASGDTSVMQQISSQLFNTLYGVAQSGSSGQPVQSIEVEVNNKPWPSTGQGSVVQQSSVVKPATGSSSAFYYVANTGYLTSQNEAGGNPVKVEQIGTGTTAVAVSRDSGFLAVLRGSTLYTGIRGEALTNRGTGYTSISWDDNDDLWATLGSQIEMFRSGAGQGQALGEMVQVNVTDPYSYENPNVTFSMLRVAPDGVRVAIVIGGTTLAYGAISASSQGAAPQITLSPVQEQSVNDSTFTGLTWYGSDDVITLSNPGSTVTEYPVSGGSATAISSDSGMESITASSGSPLIAALSNGYLVSAAGLMGAWTHISDGSAPAYPG